MKGILKHSALWLAANWLFSLLVKKVCRLNYKVLVDQLCCCPALAEYRKWSWNKAAFTDQMKTNFKTKKKNKKIQEICLSLHTEHVLGYQYQCNSLTLSLSSSLMQQKCYGLSKVSTSYMCPTCAKCWACKTIRPHSIWCRFCSAKLYNTCNYF